MRFCPKCGGLMVPIRKNGKTYIRCTKCGFEEGIIKSKEYVVSKTVGKDERVITTSIISEGRGRSRTKEEYEQEKEEYYEIFLELMKAEEESESGEE